MDARSTLILVLILFIATMIAAYLLIQEKKRRKELCKEIEMLLAGFVDSGQIKQEQLKNRNNAIFEISNNDLDRIYRQLIKLQSYMKMLRDKAALEQEEVKAIVTDISHQLKNPVAVMDMSLSLLEDVHSACVKPWKRSTADMYFPGFAGCILLNDCYLQHIPDFSGAAYAGIWEIKSAGYHQKSDQKTDQLGRYSDCPAGDSTWSTERISAFYSDF